MCPPIMPYFYPLFSRGYSGTTAPGEESGEKGIKLKPTRENRWEYTVYSLRITSLLNSGVGFAFCSEAAIDRYSTTATAK